jgi:DNA-binding CsgD family transcriptional regulator
MVENLSPRQQELFNMLLNGISPKEIAYNLNIAYNTLLFHQKKLYRKLGVHNVQELIVNFSPEIKSGAANEKVIESETITIRKKLFFGILGIHLGLLIVVVVLFILFFINNK